MRRSPALGRALLLLLLLAGLLGMHGFTQVGGLSAPDTVAHVGAVTHVGAVRTTAGEPAPAPGGHEPSGVHEALMGCVLALVGIATLAVVHRGPGSGRRTRASRPSPAAPVGLVHRAVLPPGTPLHLSLCVQRV